MTSRNVVRYVITADATEATQALDRSAQATEGVNKKLGGLAAAAGAYLAAQAVGYVKEFVGDSVRAFSDLEQSVGGTEAVFGDARGAVDEFARTSAQTIGLAESEFRTATTSIGGQLKRMTGDVELAAEQSIVLTQTAADLAATYGGTTAEAVAALGAAFRGEADPAERFNLNLKIGAQNAKAVEMGLAETTNEVDDHARALALLELISEQSADAQGQFTRELDTVAGRAQVTAAQLENHKAIVGETMAVYSEWGNVLQLEMGRALGNLALGIQELTGDISEAEATLKRWELAGGQTIDTLESLGNQIRAVTDEARNISFWGDLFSNAKEEAGNLEDTLPGMIAALELSVDELKAAKDQADVLAASWGLDEEAAAVLAATLEAEYVNAHTEAMEASRRLAAQSSATAGAHDQATAQQIADLEEWKAALGAAAESHDAFVADVLAGVDKAVTGFHELVDENQISLEEWAENRAQAALEYDAWLTNLNELQAAGFGVLVDDAKRAGFESSRGMVQEAVDTLNGPDGFSKLNDVVAGAGEDIGRLLSRGFALGINKNAADIVEAARAAVRRAENAARNEARVESPSRLFAESVGEPIAEGIAAGIDTGAATIDRAVRGAVGRPARGANGHHGAPGAALTPATASAPVYITVNALDPQSAARAVVEALQAYEHRNGAVPITTRGGP